MSTNIETVGGEQDLRETIRRMYVDGELDANTATRRLLTLDSQRRGGHSPGHDEAPAAGGA
jgi:hypothetical protein